MKYEELRWESRDALELYTQKWEPENDLKGVVCLVHGLGEHSGRYLHWADRLVGAGYAVLISDLRGHGKSEGQRGHTPSFDHYADDVSILLEAAADSYPGKPAFLYGHSLGGLIVLYYLIQRRPEIAGAVVTGSALHSAVAEQKVKVYLARLLGSITPTGSMPSGLEQEAISSDSAVVEAYRKDPLVHDRVSFGFGKQSLQAIDYVFNNASRINLPLLIMHGTDDRLAYASGVKELAGLIPGDCTLKLWEKFYHEIHNEAKQDEVFTYLKKWLDSKI